MVAFDIKRIEAYPYPKMLKKKNREYCVTILYGPVSHYHWSRYYKEEISDQWSERVLQKQKKMTPDLHVHQASHPPELYDHG